MRLMTQAEQKATAAAYYYTPRIYIYTYTLQPRSRRHLGGAASGEMPLSIAADAYSMSCCCCCCSPAASKGGRRADAVFFGRQAGGRRGRAFFFVDGEKNCGREIAVGGFVSERCGGDTDLMVRLIHVGGLSV